MQKNFSSNWFLFFDLLYALFNILIDSQIDRLGMWYFNILAGVVIVIDTSGYPRDWKIFLIVFPAYFYHSDSLLFWSESIWRGSKKSILASLRGRRYFQVPPDGRKNILKRFSCIFTSFRATFTLVGAIWRDFPKSPFWHPCVVVGTPRYPQMVEKIFLIIFPTYLHHSESLLLWSEAIWRNFQKSPFWHPCVIVGTPRYPQMVEKTFLIVFPAYLHHSESLLRWSDAIWRDFSKSSFFDPYPEVPKSISDTPQCFKNTPKPYNSQWDTMRKILVKKLFWL